MNHLSPDLRTALEDLARAGSAMSEAGQTHLARLLAELKNEAELAELRAALEAAEAEEGAHDSDDVRAFTHAYLDRVIASGQA